MFVLKQDFVKGHGAAIKLSLKVVNVLVHAAACGFGAGSLIPHLNLSEHEELFGVLKADIQDLEKEAG